MRKINLTRNTLETQITLELNLDECKTSVINTGVGFFDHMLTLFARHSGCTLNLTCIGDLQVDSHHTVEDCGILLGRALGELPAGAGTTDFDDRYPFAGLGFSHVFK